MFSDMYVVFEGDDNHWYSRFLHNKIKHCYVVVPSIDCCIVHSRTTAKFDLFNESDINGIIDPNSIIIGYNHLNLHFHSSYLMILASVKISPVCAFLQLL